MWSLVNNAKVSHAVQNAGILLAFDDPRLHGVYKEVPSMSTPWEIHKGFVEPLHAITHSWPFAGWGSI